MSPIYIPPAFCGINAKLKLKKELMQDGIIIPEGTICKVVDLIGFAYMIELENPKNDVLLRFKNGEMDDYFYILQAGEKLWIEKDFIENCSLFKVILTSAIVIKDVVCLEKSKEFYASKDIVDDGKIYWNLFDIETKERILRLRNDEYIMYCKEKE